MVLCLVFTSDQFRELGHTAYLSGREQLLYTSNCLDVGEITRERGDRRQNSRHVSNSNFLTVVEGLFQCDDRASACHYAVVPQDRENDDCLVNHKPIKIPTVLRYPLPQHQSLHLYAYVN